MTKHVSKWILQQRTIWISSSDPTSECISALAWTRTEQRRAGRDTMDFALTLAHRWATLELEILMVAIDEQNQAVSRRIADRHVRPQGR